MLGGVPTFRLMPYLSFMGLGIGIGLNVEYLRRPSAMSLEVDQEAPEEGLGSSQVESISLKPRKRTNKQRLGVRLGWGCVFVLWHMPELVTST